MWIILAWSLLQHWWHINLCVRFYAIRISIFHYFLEDMLCILKGLLCKVSLPFDLDVQWLWNIGDNKVYQLAHSKHYMFKHNHKCKLQSKDLPMDGSEGPRVVPESSIVTFRLKRSINKNKFGWFILCTYMSFVNPVFNWRFWKCEHNIVLHDSSLAIFILINKLLYEIACECYQKSLQKISLF